MHNRIFSWVYLCSWLYMFYVCIAWTSQKLWFPHVTLYCIMKNKCSQTWNSQLTKECLSCRAAVSWRVSHSGRQYRRLYNTVWFASGLVDFTDSHHWRRECWSTQQARVVCPLLHLFSQLALWIVACHAVAPTLLCVVTQIKNMCK